MTECDVVCEWIDELREQVAELREVILDELDVDREAVAAGP